MSEQGNDKGSDALEALRPFAMLGGPDDGCAAAFHDLEDDVVVFENSGQAITAGDVRLARKLVSAFYQPTQRRSRRSNAEMGDTVGNVRIPTVAASSIPDSEERSI